MPTGVVKSFNEATCWGFITPDDGSRQEVFVHLNDINASDSFKSHIEGQRVEYEVIYNEDQPKPQAKNVRPYNGAKESNAQSAQPMNTPIISEKSEKEVDMQEYIKLLTANYNLILTGAPGTGKTYLAKQIAMQMTGAKNEEELEKSGQSEFVQFHPSYDYTDFVEGLRPRNGTEQKEIGFELKNGIFKEFCDRARNACFEQSGGVDNFDDAWDKFITEVEDYEDEVAYDKLKTVKQGGGLALAITDVDRDSNIIEFIRLTTLNQKNKGWIIKDRCYDVYCKKHRGCTYSRATVKYLEEKFGLTDYSEGTKLQIDISKAPKYIFIIDEINRGEISKIFGELFFSIDPSYRDISGAVKTQYSNMHNDKAEKFYVPGNVYIIGTMNDIDRSVESFDFAMRRRFTWKEIKANENTGMLSLLGDKEKDAKDRLISLNNVIWDDDKTTDNGIEGLNSSYHIGASYFLKFKNYMKEPDPFAKLWEYHLEPLLKEYLRGRPDVETILVKLKNAYDEPNSGKTGAEENATSKDH
jgi:cold shock CspA family protein